MSTGAFGKKYLPETLGGSVIVFDADGDARPDICSISIPKTGRGKGGHAGLSSGALPQTWVTAASPISLVGRGSTSNCMAWEAARPISTMTATPTSM